MVKYKVIYESKTGNTKTLATQIYSSLGVGNGDIEEISSDTRWDDAEYFLIGFWTDRGSCSQKLSEFLGKLSGKKVLLFGTCGFGADPSYYDQIEENVKKNLPEDAQYLGCYMCQGKMPMSVRDRYEKMLEDPKQRQTAQMMIENFDQALLHPNQDDFEKAAAFVRERCQ